MCAFIAVQGRVALTKVTVAVFKVWEVLTAAGVSVRRMRSVSGGWRLRGRVRGREQQPRGPGDHVQHPVTNRHQGLHRPLNIGLNVLKKKIIMVCMLFSQFIS